MLSMSIDVEFAAVEAGNCDIRRAAKPRLSFAFTSMKTLANLIRWSLEISAKSSLSNDVCAESNAWFKELIHSIRASKSAPTN